MTNKPKYRKKLNTNQLKILELLSKFRFGTTDLLAKVQGKKNGTSIRSRLSILYEQNYIDRHYHAADRLHGKYAVYYLTPKGVRALSREDTKAIKRAYKNKLAGRGFIDHNLRILSAHCELKTQYGDDLKFFTKTDLEEYSYFPQPLPDAFLSLNDGFGPKRFFLELFDAATPMFALNNRIKQLTKYHEGGEWDATNSIFPIILIICETPKLQTSIKKLMIASSHESEVVFASTNDVALNTKEAWSNADNEGPVSIIEL